ncbi:MAG: globin [Dehalococcoidia bacterium]|nr:globin [Dehalococcoidia bacterium]
MDPELTPLTESPLLTIEAQAYDALGDRLFRDLVAAFYRRVAADPLLRPMFPDDLGESRERQYLFLIQYFGGPRTYSDLYGHPRLRMRHFPFPIGLPERNAWLKDMLEAIDEVAVPEPWAEMMRQYFERASIAMMNR